MCLFQDLMAQVFLLLALVTTLLGLLLVLLGEAEEGQLRALPGPRHLMEAHLVL